MSAAIDYGGRYSPGMQALLRLSPEQRRRAIKALPPSKRVRLLHDWSFWGRPEQIWRPGAERHTVYLAGRGWGKTRVGAEAAHFVAQNPWLAGGRRPASKTDKTFGQGAVLGIAGRTANDVNETMLYGPSGIMTVSPPWFRPRHIASRKLLVWPNGAIARLMSGDAPESFRGPNFGWVWTDEMPHWGKLKKSWSNLKYTHRHGPRPLGVHTTTPIGVTELIDLIFAKDRDGQLVPDTGPDSLQGYRVKDSTRVVTGSTYANVANLAPDFLAEILDYEGTAEAEQEIHAVIHFGKPGAPWKRDWIRRCSLDDVPEIVSLVVGVDPTVSEGQLVQGTDEPCECGIVAVGLGVDGCLYVFRDWSGVMSPKQWAKRAVDLYRELEADEIAVEDNQGGALVESNLRTFAPHARVKIRRVHATKNKFERAGLVAPVWEKGKAYHVGDSRQFVRVEHQICSFDPAKGNRQPSDRMDALVWASLACAGDGTDRRRLRALGRTDVWATIAEAMQRKRGKRWAG